MKKLYLSLWALSLSVSGFAAAQDADVPEVDFGTPEVLVIESGDTTHNFNVEIADTEDKQARGLMFRQTLAGDAGMLFEFATPKVATIWMKNTEISLDIIFIRANGEIVKIEHSTRPQTLRSASSEAVVAAVLELPGGRAAELGIEPGHIVKHAFFSGE